MAARPKITSRITSLAHAFVHAIIPRHLNEYEQTALYQLSGLVPGECVYCGAKATDFDHFNALVKAGKPSGFFHSAENVVPSCGTCNQSKSGTHWRLWITGTAKGSPASRSISDLPERIERLEKFETLTNLQAVPVEDMRNTAGPELWDAYWLRLETLRSELLAAERDAVAIRQNLAGKFLADKMSV